MARLNRILNKAIKVVIEVIITLLANTVTIYFFKGELLNYYKEIIIVVLRKANKKDYSLLGSY